MFELSQAFGTDTPRNTLVDASISIYTRLGFVGCIYAIIGHIADWVSLSTFNMQQLASSFHERCNS